MYEMLTGCKPFNFVDGNHSLRQIAYKNPPAPHTVDSAVPLVVSNIVMKAMSKRPEKRYQKAREMTKDIRRYALNEKRTRRNQQQSAAQEPPGTGTEKKRRFFGIADGTGLRSFVGFANRFFR